MSSQSWIELGVSAAALLLMTLAATVEALTGAVSRQRLRRVTETRGPARRSVQAILEPARSLSLSLLIVQIVALLIATSLLTSFFRRVVERYDHVLAVVVSVLAFLVLGRALPRALASGRFARALPILGWLGGLMAGCMRPLMAVVNGANWVFARLLPNPAPEPPPAGSEEELRAITHTDREDGMIEAEEQQMIDAVLHLEEITVREIMVPRIDIVAVGRTTASREVVETIIGAGHSRIPVYDESIDQILGILYAKDLLPFLIGPTDEFPLEELVRPAYVVPESKRIDDLLKELRRARVHIAIVVDEYGGTAGLVTIEDILEEIVGEIQDEYDTEVPLFEVIDDRQLVADGRLPLQEVEEALQLEFGDNGDFDTLGGFVQKHLGRLPREGDRFEAEGISVEILAVERHRVRRMRVTKVAPPSVEADSSEAEGRAPTGVGAPARLNGA